MTTMRLLRRPAPPPRALRSRVAVVVVGRGLERPINLGRAPPRGGPRRLRNVGVFFDLPRQVLLHVHRHRPAGLPGDGPGEPSPLAKVKAFTCALDAKMLDRRALDGGQRRAPAERDGPRRQARAHDDGLAQMLWHVDVGDVLRGRLGPGALAHAVLRADAELVVLPRPQAIHLLFERQTVDSDGVAEGVSEADAVFDLVRHDLLIISRRRAPGHDRGVLAGARDQRLVRRVGRLRRQDPALQSAVRGARQNSRGVLEQHAAVDDVVVAEEAAQHGAVQRVP
mmetsp:Transcript_17232/g.61224  ORF Transcript_17232/g.61224 Transcript_17232/m.61224 type:complete len:282 (-) Transcript_17232:512-1357(-)